MTHRHSRQSGFSLLEVVISLGILMSLTIAVASMLRAGFDIKQGLSDKAGAMHRLSVVMDKLASDVQMAFMVSPKDAVRNGIDRHMASMFKVERGAFGDKISITTRTHRPMVSGAYESEFTFVVYELKDSKEQPGRKDLFRAETPAIPLDLKEAPPERLLARNIKSIDVQYFKGDDWSKNDVWDSTRGDSRNMIPVMVKITVEAWVRDHLASDSSTDEGIDADVDKLSTVVYLLDAVEHRDITVQRQPKSVSWGRL